MFLLWKLCFALTKRVHWGCAAALILSPSTRPPKASKEWSRKCCQWAVGCGLLWHVLPWCWRVMIQMRYQGRWDIVETFRRPAVIRRPHSDSAPGELRPPFPSLRLCAQGALRQFTQWLWIEHPIFWLSGGHFTNELLPSSIPHNAW